MLSRIIVYLILIFSHFLPVTFAQQNLSDIEDDIKAELGTKYGYVYRIGSLEDVDEKVNTYRDFKFPITDPYTTLHQCYIFQADVNSGALFGVYKNGAIAWDSGPMIEFGEYADIIGTMDLNNDGYVEILGGIYYVMHNSYQSIWVFSWDGQNGEILNDYVLGSHLNQSVIFSFDWQTEICDVNGDGIQEIIGQDEETRVTKVYSWNGVKYGDYGLEMPQFIPMNLLSAKVSCKVTPSQNGLTFTYTVSNDSTSKQAMWRISVEKMFDLVYNFSAPNKWQGAYSWEWDNLLKWVIIKDTRFYPYNLIKPGNSLDSMSFTTDSIIPFISTYYLQGKNGESFPDDQYIFENSFKGKTICGKNPPEPFIPQEFLDTLINYKSQSFQLGWIKNQTTANKYDSLFNLTKVQLQQNNNIAVKATLQTVLQQVDIDSTDNLTSEAYALIRYNTEYLIEKIPQSSPNLVVKLKNSLGNQIPASNVTYYENSWKDAVNNGDGTFTVITTKPKVSIRVYYEYASLQADNVTAQNNTYTFQTVNAAVQLKNSLGAFIDQGTVQYYAGAWRTFGTTSNGVAYKELLPINYSFRMTYEYVSQDKQQNLSTNPVVDFNTVLCSVKVSKTSNNQPISNAAVKYYAGAWRNLGTTNSSGIATKELLPANISFRATSGSVSVDKQQDISVNNLVEILLNIP